MSDHEDFAMESASLLRPDTTLRYDTTGDGPDVLLLHAGGESRQVWHPVMRSLAKRGFRSTAYDQRAHGESGGDSGQPVTVYGEDTAAMMARLILPTIVGASLGGFAALMALADRAVEANAAGLVLVDVVADPDPDRTRRFLASLGMEGLPLVEDILGRRDALRHIARGLCLPVLLVRAGIRTPMSDDDAARFVGLVPHATVVTVPEAGHLVARDRPEELASALSDFLLSDLVRDRRIGRFLSLTGAGAIVHPGGTLEQHLHRTAELLRSWGAPHCLVDAARLHAAYGTDSFQPSLVPDTDGDTVARAVGRKAERTIRLYGQCDRERSYPTWHSDAPVLFERQSGRASPLDDEQRSTLIELTIANELDVMAHDRAIAARSGAALRQLFARWMPFVNARARAAISVALQAEA